MKFPKVVRSYQRKRLIGVWMLGVVLAVIATLAIAASWNAKPQRPRVFNLAGYK